MSRLEDAANASPNESEADPVWNCEEIERLYRQALMRSKPSPMT